MQISNFYKNVTTKEEMDQAVSQIVSQIGETFAVKRALLGYNKATTDARRKAELEKLVNVYYQAKARDRDWETI